MQVLHSVPHPATLLSKKLCQRELIQFTNKLIELFLKAGDPWSRGSLYCGGSRLNANSGKEGNNHDGDISAALLPYCLCPLPLLRARASLFPLCMCVNVSFFCLFLPSTSLSVSANSEQQWNNISQGRKQKRTQIRESKCLRKEKEGRRREKNKGWRKGEEEEYWKELIWSKISISPCRKERSTQATTKYGTGVLWSPCSSKVMECFAISLTLSPATLCSSGVSLCALACEN